MRTFAPNPKTTGQSKAAGERQGLRQGGKKLYHAPDRHERLDAVENREAPPIVRKVLESPGQPLDAETRTFMEPRFVHDFSRVRVHSDAMAEEATQTVKAHAFTAGGNIVFNAGIYPGKDALTAHELTHVIQQSGGIVSTAVQVSKIPSPVVQRQCLGEVGSPNRYAATAGPNLRCDFANTGIPDEELTSRITNGRAAARVMIDDTLTVLQRMDARTASAAALDHFRRLFHLPSTGPTPGQIQQAISIYNQICSWLISPIAAQGGSILCLTQGIGECRGGIWAGSSVCPFQGPINLCPDGISTNSRVTAEHIIHEAAHRFGVCTSGSAPERYENQRGFPTQPALTTSADSYSAFAREASNLMGLERVEEQRRREEESGMVERQVPSTRR